MSEHNNAGLDIVFNAGSALGITRQVGEVPYVVVPEGFSVESLEHMLDAPVRTSRRRKLNDEKSFVDYVNKHKEGDTELLYNLDNPKFVATFDAPLPGSPKWETHTAQYDCPYSLAWEEWNKHDGSVMSQEEFAIFIERNLPDIVSPESAEMLEIVRTLQAKKKVNFVSGLRLSDGSNEFVYEEEVQGSAAKGKLQVPEEIQLGMPVFDGGTRYGFNAKFRYRIRESRLTMWYELVRKQDVLKDAMAEMRERIEAAVDVVAFNAHC